ncbi:MAG TPA: hypothetical protein ENI87_00630 [bacterium]|nr:hypothetical protein [bacterium]
MATPPRRCPACGSSRGVVHVHGHGQCLTCGTNVEPCCAGDSGHDAATLGNPAPGGDATPHLFPLVFDDLGGREVAVTTDALLFALANRLAGDLDEARLLLEAAERVGIVRTSPPGVHRLGQPPASSVGFRRPPT